MESTKRLLALDVFRGLTVALMIVVNNPGSWESVYPPLLHSYWHGCTPTDLVFPFFLFIIGAAMWYSNKKSDHTLSGKIVIRILRRTALIYLIGLAINAYAIFSPDLSKIRLMGILPRIALAYCAASFIVLGLSVKWVRILIGFILLAYWAILVVFGGDTPFTLEGNFVGRFDTAVLGIKHVAEFHGAKFDQTGLLSTLPSLVNVLFGYLAGRLIDRSEAKITAIKKLVIYGIAGIVIALVWNFILPMNKPLWTSSFALYTSGFAFLFLGLLLWIIDIKGFTGWAKPFLVFGINPLFLYVFSEILAITLGFSLINLVSGAKIAVSTWIFSNCFLPIGNPVNASLLYALVFTFICWLAGWVLYKKKIIIKI
jgi:predicted acyltransferase